MDPWVIQLADRYVMFYCRNSWQEGPYFPSPDVHDRIWRAESRDGISNWTDAHAVVEGVHSAQDDLSCSPGVVVAPDGTWHLYYMTASRDTMCVVEMWHATASAPGQTWTKLGKIAAVQTSDCSLLQPSPAIENGKIVVYFVVDWAGATRLWRMESSDGHVFSYPLPVGAVAESCNARPSGGMLVYSNVPGGGCAIQTTEMRLAAGLVPGPVILSTQPGTFYATSVSAGNYLPGPPARVYFAGNYLPNCATIAIPLACSDYPNSIGVLMVDAQVPTPTPIATPPSPCAPGPGGGCDPTPTPAPTAPVVTPTPLPEPTAPPCAPGPGGGGGCVPPAPVSTPTPAPTPTPSPIPAPPAITTGTGPCTLAGSILKFEPNPPGVARPYSLAQFLSIGGFFPYQPSGAGPRLLVTELFGYQVVDITNRGNPRALYFEDYRLSPTYPGPIPCPGDCHGSISGMAVSADGGRAMFGLSDLGASGSNPRGTMIGQSNGIGFTLSGYMMPASPNSVLVQQAGPGYVAYTFADDGVRVANVTTLPGLSPDTPLALTLTSLPTGYLATLSGYWITYTNGSTIYLVDASSPPSILASSLTARGFTKADFGRSSDSLVSFSAAQDPANPAAVYLLGEFASGSQHAGYTLIRVQGGTPTVVGSLRPGAGETATYVNSLGADNAGNLFAFMWVRTAAGAYRQYTSPVPTFGAASGFFDVTTPGFVSGRPALVPGTGAGQIYEYVPSGTSGWVVPMNCRGAQ